jgi:hypothetical protein
MWLVWVTGAVHVSFSGETPGKDIGVDGKIILKCFFQKLDGTH